MKLKTIVFFLIIFTAILSANDSARHQYIGLKFAPTLNFYKNHIQNNLQYDRQSGFQIGVFREFNLGKLTSIMMEPSFEYTSNQFYYQYNRDSSRLITDKILFIELPFYLRFKLGDKIKFITDIGVNIFTGGVVLSNEFNEEQERALNIRNRYQGLLKLTYGAGMSYDISPRLKWSVMLRHFDRGGRDNFSSNQVSLNSFIFFKL
jgi:hypothetical protein